MTDTEKLAKCIEALQSIPHCEDPLEMLHAAQDVLKEIGEPCHSGLTEDY
jgi:hypothetical protein